MRTGPVIARHESSAEGIGIRHLAKHACPCASIEFRLAQTFGYAKAARRPRSTHSVFHFFVFLFLCSCAKAPAAGHAETALPFRPADQRRGSPHPPGMKCAFNCRPKSCHGARFKRRAAGEEPSSTAADRTCDPAAGTPPATVRRRDFWASLKGSLVATADRHLRRRNPTSLHSAALFLATGAAALSPLRRDNWR